MIVRASHVHLAGIDARDHPGTTRAVEACKKHAYETHLLEDEELCDAPS